MGRAALDALGARFREPFSPIPKTDVLTAGVSGGEMERAGGLRLCRQRRVRVCRERRVRERTPRPRVSELVPRGRFVRNEPPSAPTRPGRAHPIRNALE